MKVTQNNKQNNTPSTLKSVTGFTVGSAIIITPNVLLVKKLLSPLTDEKIAKKKKFLSKYFHEIDSFDKIHEIAGDIIEKEPTLKAKRLKIQICNNETLKKQKYSNKNTIIARMLRKMKENINKTFANGLNACFNFKENCIKFNDKSLYSAAFHEIGHAMNFHTNKASKGLQILRTFCQISGLIIPVFPLTCLWLGFSANKNKKNNEQTKSDKIKTFIHNNAGALTFLYFTPILAEEALASIRGINAAKKYLTSAQNKIHVKNQLFALSTYLGSALIFASNTALGKFVKNKIVNDKA